MTIVRKKETEHVDCEYDLTEQEEAELEEAVAEIGRGESVDGDWVQQELRRRRGVV